jgi:methionine sulfoxide reductase heme-binding subunit
VNPQFWWFVSRASGIVAWLFLTAAVLWGIVLSTKLFPQRRRPAWLLDLHRALGALTVVSVAIHLGALVADNFVHFSAADLFIPFASDWKTWPTAAGVIGFWGLVLVEGTSLMMKRLPRRAWRSIHLTSYLTFVVSSLHGTFAGTDVSNRLYVATSIVTTVMLVAAVTYRVITRPAIRQRNDRVGQTHSVV